jgi:hypothetical protein
MRTTRKSGKNPDKIFSRLFSVPSVVKYFAAASSNRPRSKADQSIFATTARLLTVRDMKNARRVATIAQMR